MKPRTLAFGSLLLLLVPLWATENYPVKVERAVSVKMRDGVILRGDIFRPDAEGKFPVLLQRTPYRRAAWGYDESEDGYDTFEWTAAKPYSDGRAACSALPMSEQRKC